MAAGRGPKYSREENEVILASPFGEPTEALMERLRGMGFPERSYSAVKAQKKMLNDRARILETANPAAQLGERYAELATELEHLDRRRTEVLDQLREVSLDMVRMGLGIEPDGVMPEEVKETLRRYVTEFTTEQRNA